MEAEARPTIPVEPPRGTFQARVDEKGRLKLPAAMLQYLGRLGESKVFITTVDVITVRIYPISVWKENEALLAQGTEDPESTADVQMVANHYGGDSDLDGQGRVLVPSELRRELAVENQPVWLECQKGRINLYSQPVYEQRLERAKQGIAEKLRALEKKGFR